MSDRPVLVELAAFAAESVLAPLPPALLDTLRLHLFDTCTALIVGAHSREAQAAADVLRAAGGSGGTASRAMSLAIAARCTEIDDIHLGSCTTPGSVVVSTALALAYADPTLEAARFVAGLLAGYELLTRLGKAIGGPSILYRGIWPTYLAAGLGAAATAAPILGLDTDETAHALATALTRAAGVSARSSGGIASRWLVLGCAVQDGVLAAMAARHGFRSDVALLDEAWPRITGIGMDTRGLIAGLERSFETAALSFKPYCSAKQAISSIAAFVRILDQEHLDPASIERITVCVPSAYAAMIDRPRLPADRLESVVSVQYQLALAAYHRSGLRDVLRPVLHQDEPSRQLMAKVEVQADEGLSAFYPQAWPARVEVKASTGQFEREVHHTSGDPSQPFNWRDAVDKFEAAAAPFAEAGLGARLAEVCRGLGTTLQVRDLFGMMPPP